jgi:hypothetical protein
LTALIIVTSQSTVTSTDTSSPREMMRSGSSTNCIFTPARKRIPEAKICPASLTGAGRLRRSSTAPREKMTTPAVAMPRPSEESANTSWKSGME